MKVLIIDSDLLFAQSIGNFLSVQLGHSTRHCTRIEEGLNIFDEYVPDLVITELMMPGMDGFDLIDKLRSPDSKYDAGILILCGEGDNEAQIKALEAGADDVLCKPIPLELLAIRIKRLEEILSARHKLVKLSTDFESELQLRLQDLKTALGNLQKEYQSELGFSGLGVYSDTMRQITQLCLRIHKDRDLPVLITGETGTGKELIARLIHYGDENSNLPFISLNCSAIPATLFESELFGYERGAFTGSNREGKIGKLEMANGGTLFLDEIGDLPLDLQPKLLRVIQEQEMYRVGGTKKIPLDIRFLFATHQDLHKSILDKTFRQDLFYRISTIYINIPPLRERKEEIIPLSQLFLKQISVKKHMPLKFLKEETAQLIKEYDWPGNVRELLGAMERAYLITDEVEISPDNFSFLLPNSPLNLNFSSRRKLFLELPEAGLTLSDFQTRIIQKVLELHNNNKSQSARYLGISLNRLKRLLQSKQI
ncbi:MAG: sigma-54 dependent transcriptional regulator [Candidatus Cloacimonadaceae bacterium]